MKIVADRAIPFVDYFFNTLGSVKLCEGNRISRADLIDADALIVRTVTRINRDLLEGTNVRIVASATSGHDHVDTEYLQQQGIHFISAPGCNARSVAEFVLSSLFVLAQIGQFKLADKVVGIIGCGHVGIALYGFLRTLEINCLLHDPLLQQAGSHLPLVGMEAVLGADILSLHVPLTRTGPFPTLHMLNSERLARVSKDAIIINTSRGGVIDESALVSYMESAPDSAVVMDVWENEPAINRELVNKVSIATPHIAGYSSDAKLQGTATVFAGLSRLAGTGLNLPPLPELPLPETATIDLSGFDELADAVQMAVLAGYDVRTDCAALRQTMNSADADKKKLFSELRNQYPVRREFPAMTVRLAGQSILLEQQLQKLGFKVESAAV